MEFDVRFSVLASVVIRNYHMKIVLHNSSLTQKIPLYYGVGFFVFK